jgi:hypothetical protein
MSRPEFPADFVRNYCPKVQEAGLNRFVYRGGLRWIIPDDMESAECAIILHPLGMRCKNCKLHIPADSDASVLYREAIKDYYASEGALADDVGQQTEEGKEGKPSEEVAEDHRETLVIAPRPGCDRLKPLGAPTCAEGPVRQEKGEDMSPLFEDNDYGEVASEIAKATPRPSCEGCERRKKRNHAVCEHGQITLASKEELLSRLKAIIDRQTLRTGWAETIGQVVDITDLTREQAALCYFELLEYGKITSQPKNV